MLRIYICEDRPEQRELIERLVNKVVMEEDYNLEFAVSFDNPTTLLGHLEINPVKGALYFLDVDLQHEMNGIELGAKIREIDISATIVFVTTHSEMAHLVFVHKVEALEYIIKDDPKKMVSSIKDCIQLAYRRYLDGKHSLRKYFVVNTGASTWNVPYDEILYFETHVNMPHKLILHTATGEIDFRGKLSDVIASAPEFFTCHRSFVVNPEKIKYVDKAKKKIELINGEVIPVSALRMSELLRTLLNEGMVQTDYTYGFSETAYPNMYRQTS
ncbi:MAG: LytTR family DNA-binding domain-containing protein [Oscillospiraceae bacterium]|nr:LytTR family DNA-binding domain-containing protein [Oscillospiraceae bacterium]